MMHMYDLELISQSVQIRMRMLPAARHRSTIDSSPELLFRIKYERNSWVKKQTDYKYMLYDHWFFPNDETLHNWNLSDLTKAYHGCLNLFSSPVWMLVMPILTWILPTDQDTGIHTRRHDTWVCFLSNLASNYLFRITPSDQIKYLFGNMKYLAFDKWSCFTGPFRFTPWHYALWCWNSIFREVTRGNSNSIFGDWNQWCRPIRGIPYQNVVDWMRSQWIEPYLKQFEDK
jgi:hypothetical protein